MGRDERSQVIGSSSERERERERERDRSFHVVLFTLSVRPRETGKD